MLRSFPYSYSLHNTVVKMVKSMFVCKRVSIKSPTVKSLENFNRPRPISVLISIDFLSRPPSFQKILFSLKDVKNNYFNFFCYYFFNKTHLKRLTMFSAIHESRPVVGSSRSRSWGSEMISEAKQSRRFSPPDIPFKRPRIPITVSAHLLRPIWKQK
jgi:hypothetical protein